MQVDKVLFENFSGVKSYKKIVKLYAKYEKAKAKNNQKMMQKLNDEIKKEFVDTVDGLNRIYKIYFDAENTIKENTMIYTIAQIKSFRQQIEEMLEKLKTIDLDLGLTPGLGEVNVPT